MFKQKSEPPSNPKVEPADAVQQARTRARQRLIGAIVLLAIGIIGFPLVFETQPRPIPVDIPIEIPRRDSLPPLVMPPARPNPARPEQAPSEPAPATASNPAATSSASSRPTPVARGSAPASEPVMTESSADAGREIAAPGPAAAIERSASHSAPRTASAADIGRRPAVASVAAAPAASTASLPRASDGERARALLEGQPVAVAEEQRFVVQIGAFADADAARETRKQAEKLGLKTYTQVAQTPGGSRIRVRVGPFASRGEAETALAKAKSAGLAAVLLTL